MKKINKKIISGIGITSVILLAACNNTDSNTESNTESNKENTKVVKNEKERDLNVNSKDMSVKEIGKLNNEDLLLYQKEYYKGLKKTVIEDINLYKEIRMLSKDALESNDLDFLNNHKKELIDYRENISNKRIFNENSKFLSTNIVSAIENEFDYEYDDLLRLTIELLNKNITMIQNNSVDTEELNTLINQLEDKEKNLLIKIEEFDSFFENKESFNFADKDVENPNSLTVLESYDIILKPINHIKDNSINKTIQLIKDKEVNEENISSLMNTLEKDNSLIQNVISYDYEYDEEDGMIIDILDNSDNFYFGWKYLYIETVYIKHLENYNLLIEDLYALLDDIKENNYEYNDSLENEFKYILEYQEELLKVDKEMNDFFK